MLGTSLPFIGYSLSEQKDKNDEPVKEKQGGVIKGQDGFGKNTLGLLASDRSLNMDEDRYVSEFFEYDVLPRYQREHSNATKQELDAVRNAYSYPQSTTDSKEGT